MQIVNSQVKTLIVSMIRQHKENTMKNYHDLLKQVLNEGTWQANRTGTDAISIPGAMLKFDLDEGFPAVTTKKLFFNAVVGELLGFIRGYDNAADFRNLGCNVWNANANDPGKEGSPNRWLSNPNRKGKDDLGRIYGKQWREWRGKPAIDSATPVVLTGEKMKFVAEISYDTIDQLQNAINTIKNDPTNRRIIVNAWRPDEFDQMALPPCHVLFQFLVNVEKNELNLCWYQRSVDSLLGAPFNIASYALLLSMVAKITGYKPRHLTYFMADTHIYRNHVDQVLEQLSRVPFDKPHLKLSDRPKTLEEFEPSDIQLIGYECHPPIKAEMAV
jgi:thymidylate synthase